MFVVARGKHANDAKMSWVTQKSAAQQKEKTSRAQTQTDVGDAVHGDLSEFVDAQSRGDSDADEENDPLGDSEEWFDAKSPGEKFLQGMSLRF